MFMELAYFNMGSFLKGVVILPNIIDVTNLRKNYGNFEAVKGISFCVKRGSVFAFLGANGAGKSTTIEILSTLLKKSAGHVVINGYELGKGKHNDAIRRSIGIVFQESILDDPLTVKENIMLRGRLYRLSKDTLEDNYAFVKKYLQLDDIEQKRYRSLSGGQRRRTDIARALIHRPQLLFLDEPTTGLDPETRQFVWETLNVMQRDTNMTIFFSTHYMEEAEQADYIVMIKGGEIALEGTPNALRTQFAKDRLEIVFHDEKIGEALLQQLHVSYRQKQEVFILPLASTKEAIELLETMKKDIASFEVVKGTMDDVFIAVQKNELDVLHQKSDKSVSVYE